MLQPMVRRVALGAMQAALAAAGIFVIMLLFSRPAHAATAALPPLRSTQATTGLTETAASPITSVVNSTTSVVNSTTSVVSSAVPPVIGATSGATATAPAPVTTTAPAARTLAPATGTAAPVAAARSA